MKIKIKKNSFVSKLLIGLVFVSSFLFSNPVHAAEKWYYWVDSPANEFGNIGSGTGFISKVACESSSAYTGVGAGHLKSDGCYTGNDVSITSFTLDPNTTGQIGDYFTINGSNLRGLTHILFGSIETEVNVPLSDFTSVRTKVPSGATTSKITIKTQYRGTAISPTVFTVAATQVNPNLLWVFTNIQHQYIGGYATEAECTTAMNAYLNDPANGISNTSGHVCTQHTQQEINNSQSTDPIVNLDPLTVDGGSGVYKLLAPIGSLTEIDTTGKTCPGNPDIGNGIGCYLNIIFKIGIGLCAALAVIMLVINGIKYMTSESFTEKSELKKEMGGPILGLFIALGAFAILNTINPALTGSNGIQVDQVTADIVRDRADDPEFMSNIDSFDISNISVNPSDYSDPAFLGYLGHQQGVAGASAILWAAKKGYPNVPENNPFTKSDINKNMKNNFNAHSAQITIGTSNLTPSNFLKYWAVKMAAAKKKTVPQIPASIDTALSQVASETGIEIGVLRAVCRIESAKGCTNDPTSIITVNSIGYAGLFQLSNKEHQSRPGVWEKYKKSNGILLKAYDNAFAAAQYFKTNLSGINTNWTKINS